MKKFLTIMALALTMLMAVPQESAARTRIVELGKGLFAQYVTHSDDGSVPLGETMVLLYYYDEDGNDIVVGYYYLLNRRYA